MPKFRLLQDFFSLFFPRVCLACGDVLKQGEETICLSCHFHLPQTDYHKDPENPVAKHFWGRCQVENAAAFYLFQKGTKVQHLLHELKYHSKTEIGIKVGQLYGEVLKTAEGFKTVDLILPIPLHPRKRRQRGFNQSDLFAEGLSKTMETPWSGDILQRVKFSNTQTKEDRFQRWENVEQIFEVARPENIEGKHVMIVDDVITTGSTMEACINEISKVEGCKVSVATMACAQF